MTFGNEIGLFFLIGFGGTELLIIGGIIFLLFGATKLPKLARSLGESIVEFKRGVKGPAEEDALPASDDAKRIPEDKE